MRVEAVAGYFILCYRRPAAQRPVASRLIALTLLLSYPASLFRLLRLPHRPHRPRRRVLEDQVIST